MVNSINFDTTAVVVLMVPVMMQLMMLRGGFRCHGIEQRGVALAEDSRRAVQVRRFRLLVCSFFED